MTSPFGTPALSRGGFHAPSLFVAFFLLQLMLVLRLPSTSQALQTTTRCIFSFRKRPKILTSLRKWWFPGWLVSARCVVSRLEGERAGPQDRLWSSRGRVLSIELNTNCLAASAGEQIMIFGYGDKQRCSWGSGAWGAHFQACIPSSRCRFLD